MRRRWFRCPLCAGASIAATTSAGRGEGSAECAKRTFGSERNMRKYKAFALGFAAFGGIELGRGNWWMATVMILFMLLAEIQGHRHGECGCEADVAKREEHRDR